MSKDSNLQQAVTAELGWEPKVSFDEMVRRMVEHDLELLRD